jgi:hypothetical protein
MVGLLPKTLTCTRGKLCASKGERQTSLFMCQVFIHNPIGSIPLVVLR